MSNNSSKSNFGQYVALSGAALAVGGLTALGISLYNSYQEQNRNDWRYYEPNNRREEDVERRRVFSEFEYQRERLQARMREARQREEEEERRRQENELLQFKTNELAKIDEEFDKYFGDSRDTEVYSDETMNPNQRIKEEHRKRIRQREEEQRERDEKLQHQTLNISEEEEADIISCESTCTAGSSTRGNSAKIIIPFDTSDQEDEFENCGQCDCIQHFRYDPSQTDEMLCMKSFSTFEFPIDAEKERKDAAENDVAESPNSKNISTKPKKKNRHRNNKAKNREHIEQMTTQLFKETSEKSLPTSNEPPAITIVRPNVSTKKNGPSKINDKNQKSQSAAELSLKAEAQTYSNIENLNLTPKEIIKSESNEKSLDKEKREMILGQEKLKMKDKLRQMTLQQEKLEMQQFIENLKQIDKARKQFEVEEAERLQKKQDEARQMILEQEKLKIQQFLENQRQIDEARKLFETKEAERLQKRRDEKRKVVLEQEESKIQQFRENQRQIDEARKLFEMKEAERLQKRKEETTKRQVLKENRNTNDCAVDQQVAKKLHYQLREADKLEKRNIKITELYDKSTPKSQTQESQLQIEAAGNSSLSRKLVSDEKREKIREKRRRKKKLMRSTMKQLREESEEKNRELRNCLEFINSVQTVQKKTELTRLQILSRNKGLLNEGIKQNRKRF